MEYNNRLNTSSVHPNDSLESFPQGLSQKSVINFSSLYQKTRFLEDKTEELCVRTETLGSQLLGTGKPTSEEKTGTSFIGDGLLNQFASTMDGLRSKIERLEQAISRLESAHI